MLQRSTRVLASTRPQVYVSLRTGRATECLSLSQRERGVYDATLEEVIRCPCMVSVSAKLAAREDEGRSARTPRDHGFSRSRARVELQAEEVSPSVCPTGYRMSLQCIFQMLINLHDRRLVSASVTVVWCCNALSVIWSTRTMPCAAYPRRWSPRSGPGTSCTPPSPADAPVQSA